MVELVRCCSKTTEPCLRAEACRFIVLSPRLIIPCMLNDRGAQKQERNGIFRKQRIINSTETARQRYIMHELHYHKHAYLYPLARSLLCALSEKERSTWVSFKELIALVTL